MALPLVHSTERIFLCIQLETLFAKSSFAKEIQGEMSSLKILLKNSESAITGHSSKGDDSPLLTVRPHPQNDELSLEAAADLNKS